MSSSFTIAPSIISADLSRLQDEVIKFENAGVEEIHFDVMDGHFVPNITLGVGSLAAIRRNTKLFLDVHLMIYNPFKFIEAFVQAGAQRISIHLEATEELEETLKFIRTCNAEASIAINPETPVQMLDRYLPLVDQVLLMSVNPGFSGQSFLKGTMERLEELNLLLDEVNKNLPSDEKIKVQVDGGVDASNIKALHKAGVSRVVSGSHLFAQKDFSQAYQALLKTAQS